MNFPSTLIFGVFLTLLPQPAYAGPLDAYRGENRLLVLSLPSGPSAEKVAATLSTYREKIEERDLKIIDASEGAHRVPAAIRLRPGQTILLRKQLNLGAKDSRAIFILIGKDGDEKDRQRATLDLEKWFVLIDEMPMRRQEIQNQRRKTH